MRFRWNAIEAALTLRVVDAVQMNRSTSLRRSWGLRPVAPLIRNRMEVTADPGCERFLREFAGAQGYEHRHGLGLGAS